MPEAPYRTILVDSNALGAGTLTATQLEEMRRLVEAGARVVVPDVVVHELAIHLSDGFNKAPIKLAATAGFDTTELEIITRRPKDIVLRMTKVLREVGVDVATTKTEWWQEGVVRQIFLTPPGSKKGDVRTGAVDAIVALHAESLKSDMTGLVVVTADKLLVTHLESLEIKVLPNLRAVAGVILQNAPVETLREVLATRGRNPEWDTNLFKMVGAAESSFSAFEFLGFSSLLAADGHLEGTISFAVDDGYMTATPTYPEGVYSSRGRLLYTADVKLDAFSLQPISVGPASEASLVFDYRAYPLPISAVDYIELERLSIPSPQIDVRFEVSTAVDGPIRTQTVAVLLGKRLLVKVSLSAIAVPAQFGDLQYEDIRGGWECNILDLPGVTEDEIAKVGFLGAAVLREWARAHE